MPARAVPAPHSRRQLARSQQVLLFAIRAHPGLSLLGLARETGLAPDTVRAAVERLKAAKQVQVIQDGPAKRLVPRGGRLPANASWSKALLAAVGAGSRQRSIIDHLPWPRATTQHRLKRLVTLGILTRSGTRAALYTPA